VADFLFRDHICAETGRIYRSETISGQTLTGTTVYWSYLRRKLSDLSFKCHIYPGSGWIYRVDAISGPNGAGYSIESPYWYESGRIYRLETKIGANMAGFIV